jgi:hypothetical protein
LIRCPNSDEPSAQLHFVPLPPPATAEVEELTRAVADRHAKRMAAASVEGDDDLGPSGP